MKAVGHLCLPLRVLFSRSVVGGGQLVAGRRNETLVRSGVYDLR